MKITWQHVAIVALVIGAIVALSLKGNDSATTAMISLGTVLFIGIGLIVGGQQAQRDQTNGNMTKLLTMVENLAKQLALAPPPTNVVEGEVIGEDEHNAV